MPLPYTLDNHFIFGYNNIPFAPKVDYLNDTFFCEYSRCTREPENFKEEAIKTAQQVFDQACWLDRTPYIFLSGGLDSEVVVKAFIDAGVPFKTISFRYKNELSSHEEFYIDQFVKDNNLEHRYFDIDPNWLLSSEAKDFCHQSTCIRSEMLPHMKLMLHVWHNLKGLPILGNGDLYAGKEISEAWLLKDRTLPKYEWLYIEYEYIVAWFRFAIANNILGSLGFFQHNPYIALSMIKEPIMQKCLNDELEYKLSSRSTKPVVYRKYWPDLKIKMKYHGSEKVNGICIDLNRKLSWDYHSNDKWTVPIKDFEKMLSPL